MADIDSYFSSAGGTLAHRVGVYEFDKDRSGGMQTGAYIKSDAFDVRVLKVEKDGKGSSKAADRALLHSGGHMLTWCKMLKCTRCRESVRKW